MSDNTTPHEAAIAVLRERERELDAEVKIHEERAAAVSLRREELRDVIALLSRKPTVRRPRAKPCADALAIPLRPLGLTDGGLLGVTPIGKAQIADDIDPPEAAQPAEDA